MNIESVGGQLIKLVFEDFDVTVLSNEQWDKYDDNIDVEVDLRNGRRFAATFFTVRNLSSLIEKYRVTGECAHGTFVWAVEMIILRDLTEESIHATVQDLISTGVIESAMLLLD